MKLIYDPKVYLVGRQELLGSKDLSGISLFLEEEAGADCGYAPWANGANSDAERLCEIAGRVCYLSFGKPRPGGNQAYLKHILEVSHGSVLEHAVWNFIVTGVSRSFSHEFVRHRIGMSPSQLSQRYVDESVAEYVVPHDLRNEVVAAQQEMVKWSSILTVADVLQGLAMGKGGLERTTPTAVVGLKWLAAMEQASASYREMVEHLTHKITHDAYNAYVKKQQAANLGFTSKEEHLYSPEERTAIRKQARQAARSVLPNATETKLFFTINARAARHFFELRASRHAEPEIRKVAFAVWQVLVKEAPHLFGDYVVAALPDGTHELTTPHRKV